MQIIYLKTGTPISIGDKIKIDNITITITQQFIDDNKDMFEVIEELPKYVVLKNIGGCINCDIPTGRIYKLTKRYRNFHKHEYWLDGVNKFGFDDYHGSFNDFFTPSTEEEYLLQIAKERYPVGTKFRVAHTSNAIYTVKSHDRHNNTFVNNGGLAINFIKEESDFGCNSASVYYNGIWAEILRPILTTEDGKDLYEEDEYWFCWINNRTARGQVEFTPYFVKHRTALSENEYMSKNARFFSTKEACQTYIDKHKEKTLEDYEKMLYIQHNANEDVKLFAEDYFPDLKQHYPELYWHKIALLIRDDLNGNWESDWKDNSQIKYIIRKHREEIDKEQYISIQPNKLYFKSEEARDKFMELIGDKIDYLF